MPPIHDGEKGSSRSSIVSYFEYDSWIHDESLDPYHEGGYHPVVLWDTFKDGRYTIRHKLERKMKYTAWVARDNQRRRDMWVAFKIYRADLADELREVQALKTLGERAPEGLGSKYIAELHDHFIHEGPNGSHQCIVHKLYGPTLQYTVESGKPRWESPGKDWPPQTAETVLPVAEQLLTALAFMHETGYGHGGMNLYHVVLYSRQLPYVTEEQLFDLLGTPQVTPIVRKDGKALDSDVPRELVMSADWQTWWPDEIRLIDFQGSFPHGDTPPCILRPEHLTPPEMIFAEKADSRIDLWGAGMIIHSLIFDLDVWFFSGSDVPSVVEEMIAFSGEMPDAWKPRWELMQRKSRELYSELRNAGRMSRRWPQDVCDWREVLAGAPENEGEAGREGDKTDDARAGSKVSNCFDKSVEEFFKECNDPACTPLLPIVKGLMALWPADRLSARDALQLLKPIVARWRQSQPEDDNRSSENSGYNFDFSNHDTIQQDFIQGHNFGWNQSCDTLCGLDSAGRPRWARRS